MRPRGTASALDSVRGMQAVDGPDSSQLEWHQDGVKTSVARVICAVPLPIQPPVAEIADFCRRHEIARLSLFGSVLREDFSASSDIDVLVEFLAGKAPGFIAFAGMQMELSKILGRTVDLRTPADLSGYFRDEVLREARLLHAA